MSPVRALIVDDEPWARERICSLLEGDAGIRVVGESTGGADAVEAIRRLKPDLVFLDVQMPDLDGFQVLEKVAEEHLPRVIFVTAYDRHALRAFDVHAVDYLLKPFDRRRFTQAVERAVDQINGAATHDQMERLERLLNEIKPRSIALERFLVRQSGRLFFVPARAVDWIEAAGNYVCLHMGEHSHLVRRTMDSVEAKLDGKVFQRIHRSAIVNLDRIAEVRPTFSGEYSVVLRDGTELTLSKSYRDRFLHQADR
jgi:two-component system LytT family response regulator